MRAKIVKISEIAKSGLILFPHNSIFCLIILHFVNCKLGKKYEKWGYDHDFYQMDEMDDGRLNFFMYLCTHI